MTEKNVLATLLAALRYFQRELPTIEEREAAVPEYFSDEERSLSDEEIDILCASSDEWTIVLDADGDVLDETPR